MMKGAGYVVEKNKSFCCWGNAFLMNYFSFTVLLLEGPS